MDPDSAKLIVSMLQQDMSSLKDVEQDGWFPDASFAFATFGNDLQEHTARLADQELACSLATASTSDDDLVYPALSTGQQAIADHKAAVVWSDEAVSPLKSAQRGEYREEARPISHLSNENIPAASSNEDPFRSAPQVEEIVPGPVNREQDRAIANGPKGRCAACREQIPLVYLIKTPCNHSYCRECLPQLFEHAIQHEASFPPRCCEQRIPVHAVQNFLSPDLRATYAIKKLEYETSNRTYCSRKECSAFIVAQSVEDNCATCTVCGTLTCSDCKKSQHDGACVQDVEMRNMDELTRGNKWQRCNSCRRVIELGSGCNHITCFCKAEFCYLCGVEWKTCDCPMWDEQYLAEAGELEPEIVIPDDLEDGERDARRAYEYLPIYEVYTPDKLQTE